VAARKDEILDAAIAIADEHGLEAVSMRSVAERVGVTPMALYPHIGSKTALLDDMYGRIVGELLPGQHDRGTGLERLQSLARRARTLLRQRPWIVTLMFARPSVTLDGLRGTDFVYQALLDAGVPEADVPRMERLVTTFFFGFIASEAGGRFGTASSAAAREARASLTADLPGLARIAPYISKTPDWDAEYDADLADLARLIEAKAVPPGTGDPGSR
jgi:AcrR family transcriptional regulator